MPKRKTFTKREIEYDLKVCRSYPRELTRATYLKITVSCGALGLLLGILSFFYLTLSLVGLAFLVVGWVGGGVIFQHIRRARAKGAVCLDDYEVTRAFLDRSERETYRAKRYSLGYAHSREVNIYTFYFGGREPFRLPEDNYTWDKERPMSDFFLYENCLRGDEFFIVVHRATGEIRMVYPLAFFDYKET